MEGEGAWLEDLVAQVPGLVQGTLMPHFPHTACRLQVDGCGAGERGSVCLELRQTEAGPAGHSARAAKCRLNASKPPYEGGIGEASK